VSKFSGDFQIFFAGKIFSPYHEASGFVFTALRVFGHAEYVLSQYGNMDFTGGVNDWTNDPIPNYRIGCSLDKKIIVFSTIHLR